MNAYSKVHSKVLAGYLKGENDLELRIISYERFVFPFIFFTFYLIPHIKHIHRYTHHGMKRYQNHARTIGQNLGGRGGGRWESEAI